MYPVEFHEEDFKLKDWNKDLLKEVFAELEFKTLGKRVLGEDFNVFKVAPQAVQTDLFGAVVTDKAEGKRKKQKINPLPKKLGNCRGSETTLSSSEGNGLHTDKNIHNTTHHICGGTG